MSSVSFVLLYVADPRRSAEFYAEIFNRKPVELSAGYAMFVLPSGLKVGLWKRDENPATSRGRARLNGNRLCRRQRRAGGRALRPVDGQRSRHRAATHAHGVRLHLCRPRSRRPPLAGLQARAVIVPALTGRPDAGSPGQRPIATIHRRLRSSSNPTERARATSGRIPCSVPFLIGLWFGIEMEFSGGPSWRSRIWLPRCRTTE